jgi:hypothetical protein
MKTFLQHSRDPGPQSDRPGNRLSGLTIFGRHFALVWRGRGWELVAVVALLIVGLLIWLHLR